MPRARNKAELLEFGEAQYNRLIGLVGDLSEEQRDEIPVFDNRTVKDIVAHLDAWLRLFLGWYRAGMAGESHRFQRRATPSKSCQRLMRPCTSKKRTKVGRQSWEACSRPMRKRWRWSGCTAMKS
ncbi:MAG: ClbS/DfsB family four-helix bundle protein [Anaerolineales bacterium]|nr:ClbS/DfsB family four-helix bundle protein [Anaerolineales bacterium]